MSRIVKSLKQAVRYARGDKSAGKMTTVRIPRNPGEEVGIFNLERVRRWYRDHLGGKQQECADALGLSVMAVNRHVRTLRAEWIDSREPEKADG